MQLESTDELTLPAPACRRERVGRRSAGVNMKGLGGLSEFYRQRSSPAVQQRPTRCAGLRQLVAEAFTDSRGSLQHLVCIDCVSTSFCRRVRLCLAACITSRRCRAVEQVVECRCRVIKSCPEVVGRIVDAGFTFCR